MRHFTVAVMVMQTDRKDLEDDEKKSIVDFGDACPDLRRWGLRNKRRS
jgi:hypothetical protein